MRIKDDNFLTKPIFSILTLPGNAMFLIQAQHHFYRNKSGAGFCLTCGLKNV